MKTQSHWKPGQIAPFSGQYLAIGPRGGRGIEVTVVKGEPFPPTRGKGIQYKLTDRTKNQSGQK